MFIVPYVKLISEKVDRIAKSHGYKIALSGAFTLESFIKNKDRLILTDRFSVVYLVKYPVQIAMRPRTNKKKIKIKENLEAHDGH